MENIGKVMPKFVLWFWRFCWVMFGLSFFTSKSGLSIFSSLLILVSLFYINWRSFFKEKWLVLFAATVPLGMFLNLFSLGGWESSVKFILANPWPLLLIPGFYLIKQKKEFEMLLWSLLASFIFALFKSYYIFYLEYGMVLSSGARVRSYFDIGRWGQFVGAASVVLFIASFTKHFKPKNTWGFRVLLLLGIFSLLLTGSRGPWAGFGISVLFSIVFLKEYRKMLLVLGALFFFGLGINSDIRERFTSIVAVQKSEEGVITSSNLSNAGRLYMWKVALDIIQELPFAGTGFRNYTPSLQAFIGKQSDDYISKYTSVDFSFNDPHSSYLYSWIEMGGVYFVFIWGTVFACLVAGLRSLIKRFDVFLLMALSLIIYNLIVFVFYSSYATYESLLIFTAAPLLVSYSKITHREHL